MSFGYKLKQSASDIREEAWFISGNVGCRIMRTPMAYCYMKQLRSVIHFCAFVVCLIAVSVAQAQDAREIGELSSSEVEDLERRLKREIADIELELNDAKSATVALRDKQEKVDREAEKMQDEKKREAAEKERRYKELDSIKQEVREKQAAIGKMNIHSAQLNEHINKLQRTLDMLTNESLMAEMRLKEPSLLDMLDTRSQNWSSVPRQVYLKTFHDVAPALSEITAFANEYRQRVRSSSRALEVCVSMLLYGFAVGSFYVLSRIYARVRGNFTVDRILFLGDAICACFWTLVLICFVVLWKDPITVAQSRSPVFFFVFQLSAFCGYVLYVLLRVLVVATEMTVTALGEAFCVIVVGQHYYVRIWQPVILDEAPRGSLFYYLCYVWLFASFAHGRISQFHPLRQLRGPKLTTLTNIRILLSRFSRSRIPECDLETSGARAH
jgi:hypothetical protein